MPSLSASSRSIAAVPMLFGVRLVGPLPDEMAELGRTRVFRDPDDGFLGSVAPFSADRCIVRICPSGSSQSSMATLVPHQPNGFDREMFCRAVEAYVSERKLLDVIA